MKYFFRVIVVECLEFCFFKIVFMLRRCSSDDMLKFYLEVFCEEWMERVFLFYFIFMFFVLLGRRKDVKIVIWFLSVVLVGLVFLRERLRGMNVM